MCFNTQLQINCSFFSSVRLRHLHRKLHNHNQYAQIKKKLEEKVHSFVPKLESCIEITCIWNLRFSMNNHTLSFLAPTVNVLKFTHILIPNTRKDLFVLQASIQQKQEWDEVRCSLVNRKKTVRMRRAIQNGQRIFGISLCVNNRARYSSVAGLCYSGFHFILSFVGYLFATRLWFLLKKIYISEFTSDWTELNSLSHTLTYYTMRLSYT